MAEHPERPGSPLPAILAAWEASQKTSADWDVIKGLLEDTGISTNVVQRLIGDRPAGPSPGLGAPPTVIPPQAGQIGGDVVSQAPVVQAETPVTSDRFGDPFLEAEAFPERVFRGALTQDPGFQALGPQGRQVARQQFGPTFASFLTQLPEEEFGQTVVPQFRDFLGQGGGRLSPEEQAQAFQDLAARLSAANQRGEPSPFAESEQFTNPAAFQLALQAASPRVNPLFRGGFNRAAQDLFAGFQRQSPGQSFLEFLAGRGGRLFGG